MAFNPHTLSPEHLECPQKCPFLGMRTFMPNTLPFYCEQYDTFLGANFSQKIVRCAKCRGIKQNITETGLSFIDSYITDHFTIEETKQAFLKLDHGFQKMFVDLVSKTGVQIILGTDSDGNKETFEEAILKNRKEQKDKIGSPEVRSFKNLFDTEGFPLITRQTKTLLMHLFLVMDKSEKEMMKNILQNVKLVDSFLKTFSKQPHDQDLLRNVRAVVYEYDKKHREMERQNEKIRLNQRQELQRQNRLLQLQRKKTRGPTR